MHFPIMPYAYGSGLDGPSQFDDQFEGPTTESNPLKKLEQDLLNEEARYDTKYSA